MGNLSGVPRSAYTLIELLVVLSIISMLMASVSVTIHTLAILNHQLRADGPRSETLTRLSLRMRDDAHCAKDWNVEQPVETEFRVQLTRGDQSIVVYETKPEAIVRRVIRGDQTVHQELFRLPGASSIRFETAGEPIRLLTLRIEQLDKRISGAKDSVRSNEIVAALGFNTDRK